MTDDEIAELEDLFILSDPGSFREVHEFGEAMIEAWPRIRGALRERHALQCAIANLANPPERKAAREAGVTYDAVRDVLDAYAAEELSIGATVERLRDMTIGAAERMAKP